MLKIVANKHRQQIADRPPRNALVRRVGDALAENAEDDQRQG